MSMQVVLDPASRSFDIEVVVAGTSNRRKVRVRRSMAPDGNWIAVSADGTCFIDSMASPLLHVETSAYTSEPADIKPSVE